MCIFLIAVEKKGATEIELKVDNCLESSKSLSRAQSSDFKYLDFFIKNFSTT